MLCFGFILAIVNIFILFVKPMYGTASGRDKHGLRFPDQLPPNDRGRSHQTIKHCQSTSTPLPTSFWTDRCGWLIPDYHLIEDILPLKTSAFCDLRVFDVRWRMLLDKPSLAFVNPTCPHCQTPDNSEHRFWRCPEAIRARFELRQAFPQARHLSKLQLLLGYDTSLKLRPVLEAFIWRIHLAVMHANGIRTDPPAPPINHVSEFQGVF